VGPRKPPLGARANRRWLLSWPLVTHTPTPPHDAFPKAPPYDSSHGTGSRRWTMTWGERWRWSRSSPSWVRS